MKNIFLFSGQGTQYYHMAHELREHQPEFERNITRLSCIVNDITGYSIIDVVYNSDKHKSDNFSDSRLSNIALLTIEYALAETLIQEDIIPDAVCGMSLGEYTAAIVAGVLKFETAVHLVASAGACFDAYCEPGAMLAIFDDIDLYYNNRTLCDSTEIAFDSHGKHFVIAGEIGRMNDVEKYLRQQYICFQSLPVAFGYHSRNIDPAYGAYTEILASVSFSKSRIPFYSSVEARCIEHLDGEYFWRTARDPIRFMEAIESIDNSEHYRFIDLGPTGTMASLMRYKGDQQSTSNVFPIVTPFSSGHINYTKLLSEVKLNSPLVTMPGRMRAWVFPGQGSQQRGMGAGLFKRYPDLVARADKVLGYSIETLCIEDPERNLNKTQYTQPALFVVNALHYHQHMENAPPPSYVAGHSLGEYNALYAAGGVDFETGLQLVQKRGALMAQAQMGGMAAVIGLSQHQVEQVLENNNISQVVMANINSPSQIVISGPRDNILSAQSLFEDEGCERYMPLNVSGAFHSPLVDSAAQEYATFITTTKFGHLKIPVIANLSGRPYKQDDIADTLINQITHTVRWTDTVDYLFQQGVQEIEEVGPGNILSKLIAACRKQTPSSNTQIRQLDSSYI
jgi:trans-AT polyketide synthase/acyltransferase/oxidoreductase domain-containing protein